MDNRVWHNVQIDEVLKTLSTNRQVGLSSKQVEERLIQFGRNQLPKPPQRSYFNIFIGQFLNPLIYLLLLAALIAFLIGEGKDSIVILIVVVLNAIIGTFQEGRAEQSLEALRKLSKLQSRVIRDSIEKLVESSELVPGDILILAAGDAISTDARIIEASQIMTAEAALTGESLPIEKNEMMLPVDTILADRKNMLYAGTYIHSGRCLAVVTSTGLANEIGKIAKLTTTAIQPKTQLELKIHQFGRYLIYASVVVSVLVVLIGILRGISFGEIFMIAISQMVSLVPEGLPVAMTIALAVGVQRMAKRGTVVRRLSAVETLGSTTVICTDKTGTLTRNEMTVTDIYFPYKNRRVSVTGIGYAPVGTFLESEKEIEVFDDNLLIQLSYASMLCNDAQIISPSTQNETWKILGDPTEAALVTLSGKIHKDFQDLRTRFPRVAEIPFDSGIKMMATQNQIDGKNFIFIKGAPEVIINYCKSIYTDNNDEVALSDELNNQIKTEAERMAALALRVLAFAYVPYSSDKILVDIKSLFKEAIFIGLVGQIDPPRSEVAQAILESKRAGIKTVMVTGDHKRTGVAIAKSLGIFSENDLSLDGKELENLSNASFEEVIDKVTVFARVHPEQKLRIVETFQRKGHIVAMTGDGVNDAPALVKADVGVSMGITGTEVAKEASKIVITDDNFATIVAAVGEGRLVYQNIKKLILFLFVTSIDEVLVLFLALVFGYSVPLAAVQILWINLVTEGTLTINLIMEPFEGDEMQREPISPEEPLLDKVLLRRMPIMVISSVVSTFGWYVFRTYQGAAADLVQTETFTMLAVCQWFNVLNCRSATHSTLTLKVFKNPWLIGGLILGNLLHLAVVYWEPLGRFFHTVPIAPVQFFAIGAVASLVLWTEEIRKYFLRKSMRVVV